MKTAFRLVPMLFLTVPGLVLAASILGGCPGTLDNPDQFKKGDGGPVTCFDVEPEFQKTCTGAACHSAMEHQQNLDLETADIGGRLANKAATECTPGLLIDISKPESSVIYRKLTSSPPCGLRMPSSAGTPLPYYTDAQLECVLTWIQSLQPGATTGGGMGGMGTGGAGGMGTGGAPGGAGGAGGAAGGV